MLVVDSTTMHLTGFFPFLDRFRETIVVENEIFMLQDLTYFT